MGVLIYLLISTLINIGCGGNANNAGTLSSIPQKDSITVSREIAPPHTTTSDTMSKTTLFSKSESKARKTNTDGNISSQKTSEDKSQEIAQNNSINTNQPVTQEPGVPVIQPSEKYIAQNVVLNSEGPSIKPQGKPARKRYIPRWADAYERNSLLATLSVGFVDWYRQNYTLPTGFEKGNTTGFAPVYFKMEYGLSRHIGIAANIMYDAFDYNFNQIFEGNGQTFTRYKTDAVRIATGGLMGYYHFGNLIPVNNLDVFIGAGANLNNIRYSAYPQSDTTGIKLDHTLTPNLKAGARYYMTARSSVFADFGYDKQSIFSIGFTCRFLKKVIVCGGIGKP